MDPLTTGRSYIRLVSFFRNAIETLEPYTPGDQPAPGSRTIKLNTNENPYPPSPHALDALRQVNPDQLRRYPRSRGDEFREAVAEVLALDQTWVLPGNGSDELLTVLIRSVTGPGRPLVYPTPTYVLYSTLAEIQGAPAIEVPFDDNFALPVELLQAARGTLTIVANPNSPSGTTTRIERLSILAAGLKGLLVIDEAYVAFADDDALSLVQHHPNVVILRTLSKSHSLAGLRLGFVVAQPEVIEGLVKVKDSYNVGAVAAQVGAAAIRDVDHTRRTIAKIRESRRRLTVALETMGCRVWPSQANFLLIRPPDGDAKQVYRKLGSRGILVRYFGKQPLSDKLRITIGTDEEQAVLLESLAEILSGGPAAIG